ncbi:Ribonuclease D [termite gut metagenome]|jgi:ribonuclease D|uniref:Ribonuclease D n=1 Tax=termite gut metagenome TaxID=433724 RepID=A0A5J4SLS0_9ZZZZ
MNISKEEINRMPKAEFQGKIYVIQTEDEAQKAMAYLLEQKAVGIDSETRPSFKKGKTYKVALLQVASEEYCFLFRLNITGLMKSLIALLENPAIVKIGLSLRDDFMLLRKRETFTPQKCIDLQDFVAAFGIQDKSLQKIYAILFERKISKAQRLSNWESDVLTDAQQVYAATDAWACLRIYNLLIRMNPDELSDTIS